METLLPKNSMVILVVVYVSDRFYSPVRRAGNGCGKIVDKNFNGYFGCGVCKGQFLVRNNAWRDGCEMLWTENSMVVLTVGYARDSFYSPTWHGGDGCGKIVDRKLDGYFGCGACKGQVLIRNKAWRG